MTKQSFKDRLDTLSAQFDTPAARMFREKNVEMTQRTSVIVMLCVFFLGAISGAWMGGISVLFLGFGFFILLFLRFLGANERAIKDGKTATQTRLEGVGKP